MCVFLSLSLSLYLEKEEEVEELVISLGKNMDRVGEDMARADNPAAIWFASGKLDGQAQQSTLLISSPVESHLPKLWYEHRVCQSSSLRRSSRTSKCGTFVSNSA